MKNRVHNDMRLRFEPLCHRLWAFPSTKNVQWDPKVDWGPVETRGPTHLGGARGRPTDPQISRERETGSDQDK